MTFKTVLRGVQECPGVVATAISDTDGISVETLNDGDTDLEELLAEYSTFLREVTMANRELHLGELEQLMVAGERRVVMITLITNLYFLLTIVDRSGFPGKARYASRVAAHRLRHEFI